MIRKYEYRVFPETPKSRVLLAIAFLGGLGLIAVFVWAQLRAESLREDSNPACAPARYPDCLQAQDQLAPEALDVCTGSLNHVCLIPLGQVSPDLVRHLVDHYDEEYGLRIGVLKPTAIPQSLVNEERGQIDALDLARLMKDRFARDTSNDFAILIGLTPADIYISTVDWRFAFGLREPEPVVSTARMNPAFYGSRADDDLMFTRARKMVSRYIGLFYYGLQQSDDPKSPMYYRLLGLSDLDRMGDRLPVQSY